MEAALDRLPMVLRNTRAEKNLKVSHHYIVFAIPRSVISIIWRCREPGVFLWVHLCYLMTLGSMRFQYAVSRECELGRLSRCRSTNSYNQANAGRMVCNKTVALPCPNTCQVYLPCQHTCQNSFSRLITVDCVIDGRPLLIQGRRWRL